MAASLQTLSGETVSGVIAGRYTEQDGGKNAISLNIYLSEKHNVDSHHLDCLRGIRRFIVSLGRISSIYLALVLVASPSVSFAAGPASAMRNLRIAVERIKEGGYTLAPFAAVKFCLANKDQCEDSGGDDIIDLTDDRNQELLSVNAGINRAIKPVSDNVGTDSWNTDVTAGDCEDYALTKRKHLLGLGWPSRALRIAVANTPSGEGHAVLVVKTSLGDLVLDNRTSNIREWNKTDLHWIAMQSARNPKIWVNVNNAFAQPMAVSQRR